MKKLLILLVLIVPLFVFSQTPNRDEYHTYVGKPTFTAKTLNALSYDYTNKQVWKSVSTSTTATVKWELVTDQNIINSAFGILGPQGPKGDPGIPGAPGKDGVCPSCPPSGGGGVFPFIIVNGTGNTSIDFASLTTAFAENLSNRKPIYVIGNVSAGDVVMKSRQWSLTMFLYGAIWNVPASATSAIKREMPTSAKAAVDTFSHARTIIYGGTFIGYQHQIALDLGASYCAAYRDIKFENFKTAIHLRFALRTTIENCWAQNCLNGFMVDIGNWTGASYPSANAQSNQTTISNSRVDYQIAGGSGDVGIGVYGCSGVAIENCVIEGAKYKKVVDKDFKMCGNDKEFRIVNLHLEPIYGNTGSGTGEAYIYIRLVGVASIDGIYSQYTGCFVDAGGDPGELVVDIKHVGWLVRDANQKLFNNAGGVKWLLDANGYQSWLVPGKTTTGAYENPTVLSNLFTGRTTTYCNSTTGCNVNTYQLRGY